MASLKFWVVLATGFSLFLIGIGLWTEKRHSGKSTIEINQTEVDFGKIKVSETKEADFFLKNSGQKPLQLFNLSSSCGCVTAKIIKADGWESAEFGMHSPGKSVIAVAPDEQIKIRVIYRPAVMPVRGPVGREVYLSTNDPARSRLTLKIQAEVYD